MLQEQKISKRTKLAIIIIGPQYMNLFHRIGSYPKSKGIEIIYVLENKYEIYKQGYEESFKKEKAYYLIDFGREHKSQKTRENYNWLSLFSTFY